MCSARERLMVEVGGTAVVAPLNETWKAECTDETGLDICDNQFVLFWSFLKFWALVVVLFCQLYVFISKGHNGAERYLEHSNASYW